MKFQMLLSSLALSFLWAVAANADSIVVNPPNTPLAPPVTISIDSTTVTAYGYSAPGTLTNLYFKKTSPDETGLGIAAEADHEISGKEFVTFDISMLESLAPSSLALSFESVQYGDSYSIWGSNTLGVPGTVLVAAGTADGVLVLVPNFMNYKYISVDAPTGDILVQGIALNVPEPSSVSMLLMGLLGIAALMTVSKLGRIRSC